MLKGYSDLLQSLGLPYSDACMGHFHVPTNTQTPKGEWFCNGTFVGATKYTMKGLYTRVRPAQWMFFVHPEQGISGRFLLRLDRKDDDLLEQTMSEGYNLKVPLDEEKLSNIEPFA